MFLRLEFSWLCFVVAGRRCVDYALRWPPLLWGEKCVWICCGRCCVLGCVV